MGAAEWLITQILEDLDTCGLDGCRLVLKSDQEPSFVEAQHAIKDARGKAHSHGTAIENSEVGDSNSNARVERAIQELGGLVRTVKSALGSRLGQKIPLDHVVALWIIKHAASVITRYVVRDCGNTSYKLIKGRRCHERIAEFWKWCFSNPQELQRPHTSCTR